MGAVAILDRYGTELPVIYTEPQGPVLFPN